MDEGWFCSNQDDGVYYMDEEDFEKALEAGMDGHVAKPLDAAKMFQAMADVLPKSPSQI